MPRPSPDLFDSERYPFRAEIGTRFADLDPNGHLNNVAMAAAFEDARVRLNLAHDFRSLLPGCRIVVAAAHIDYLAEAHYPAPLDVRIGVIDLGRSSWTIAELALQSVLPRAFCRATLVCMQDGRPTELTQAFRDCMLSLRLQPSPSGRND